MASLEPTTIDFEAARVRAGGTIETFGVGGGIRRRPRPSRCSRPAARPADRLARHLGPRGRGAAALLGRRVRGKAVLEVA